MNRSILSRSLMCVLVALSVTSCASGPGTASTSQRGENYLPFSPGLQQEFGVTDEQLREVQFYTSSAIVLQRTVVRGNDRGVAGGVLKRSGERLIEEIVIPAFTPGVAKEVYKRPRTNTRYIEVAFNPAYPDRSLTFIKSDSSETFRLAAIWPKDGGPGETGYGGSKFFLQDGSSEAHLLVERSVLDKLQRKQQVEPGFRLKGSR